MKCLLNFFEAAASFQPLLFLRLPVGFRLLAQFTTLLTTLRWLFPLAFSSAALLPAAICAMPSFAGTAIEGAKTESNETANVTVNSEQVITIGILGDSLSAGFGLKPTETWVHHIDNTFKGLAQFPKTRFINASVSGATTDAGLQMLPALLKQEPDIVILELGANDGLQGKPLPLIYQNLTTMINQTQATGADILLLGVRLPPNIGKRYTEPFYAQFQSLATSFELAYIPFFLEDVAGKQEYMQGDGLHPNALAQPIIAERVLPELKGLVLERLNIKKNNLSQNR